MTEPEQWAVELWEAADAAFDAWPDGNAHRASHAAALSIQRAFEEREWKLREAATTQPSGDEVKAVARAIQDVVEPGFGISDRAWNQATAAITTYEAVSGVAKMREALRAFAAMAAAYDPDDGDGDQWAFASRPTIGQVRAARAALGEKP